MPCRALVRRLRKRPTKAFEQSPDEEFDFYLAEKLSMTVEQMQRSVSSEEWMRWSVYYGRLAQRRELARKRAGYG